MTELTDKFTLPPTTPASSTTTVNISGILVYLYGVAELTPEQAQDVTVVFYVHGRTRSHLDGEELAFQVLSELKGSKKGVVFASIDNRNHGTRAVDQIAIQDWKSGNRNHAQDMISMVDGIAADYQLIMKYLQAYIGSAFKITEYIPTGASLGGHTTWTLLARDSHVARAVIFVGCPNLTALLIDRLGGYTSVDQVPKTTSAWNKDLEKIYADWDQEIAAIRGKEIVILNGADDKLVADKFTKPWVEKYGSENKVTYIVQDGFGHGVSVAMVHELVKWLKPAVKYE